MANSELSDCSLLCRSVSLQGKVISFDTNRTGSMLMSRYTTGSVADVSTRFAIVTRPVARKREDLRWRGWPGVVIQQHSPMGSRSTKFSPEAALRQSYGVSFRWSDYWKHADEPRRGDMWPTAVLCERLSFDCLAPQPHRRLRQFHRCHVSSNARCPKLYSAMSSNAVPRVPRVQYVQYHGSAGAMCRVTSFGRCHVSSNTARAWWWCPVTRLGCVRDPAPASADWRH